MIRIRSPAKKKQNSISISDWKRKTSVAFFMPIFRKEGVKVANRIKGITVEIGGDTTGLDKALKGVNSTIKSTQSQLRDVNRLLKLDPGSAKLLAQKQQLLQKEISETSEKLNALKEAEKKEAKDKVEKAKTKGEVAKAVEDAKAKAAVPTPTPEPTPSYTRYDYNPFWNIYFGSRTAMTNKTVDGVEQKVIMDIAPFIEKGRTMLPIRFVAEARGPRLCK